MNSSLKKLPLELQKKIKKMKMPSFEQPMLATLTKNYFSDKDWIFERKFDGVRCLIFKNGNKVSLKSRNDKSLNTMYPEIQEAAQKLDVKQVILDGEVVAFKGKETSFSQLQRRLGITSAEKSLAVGVKVYIYIFDILYVDGYSLLDLPLMARKKILKESISFGGSLRYTTHQNTEGVKLRKLACKKGWEGLIAKRREGTYVHQRSLDWLKFKCVANQELVIGGYTQPRNSRVGFGALLMGYYQDGKLMYAGKVGTGFSDEYLQEFVKKLQAIEIKKNPFANFNVSELNVHFVKPKYVAEIGFQEWTRDYKLRQGRFQGLRIDKKAEDVILEKPEV